MFPMYSLSPGVASTTPSSRLYRCVPAAVIMLTGGRAYNCYRSYANYIVCFLSKCVVDHHKLVVARHITPDSCFGPLSSFRGGQWATCTFEIVQRQIGVAGRILDHSLQRYKKLRPANELRWAEFRKGEDDVSEDCRGCVSWPRLLECRKDPQPITLPVQLRCIDAFYNTTFYRCIINHVNKINYKLNNVLRIRSSIAAGEF